MWSNLRFHCVVSYPARYANCDTCISCPYSSVLVFSSFFPLFDAPDNSLPSVFLPSCSSPSTFSLCLLCSSVISLLCSVLCHFSRIPLWSPLSHLPSLTFFWFLSPSLPCSVLCLLTPFRQFILPLTLVTPNSLLTYYTPSCRNSVSALQNAISSFFWMCLLGSCLEMTCETSNYEFVPVCVPIVPSSISTQAWHLMIMVYFIICLFFMSILHLASTPETSFQ